MKRYFILLFLFAALPAFAGMGWWQKNGQTIFVDDSGPLAAQGWSPVTQVFTNTILVTTNDVFEVTLRNYLRTQVAAVGITASDSVATMRTKWKSASTNSSMAAECGIWWAAFVAYRDMSRDAPALTTNLVSITIYVPRTPTP
jgi:hypothetical protein